MHLNLKRLEKICLGLLFGLVCGTYAWFVFIHSVCVDEREHLSASYMIFRGLVPYRDFFEHHHPLMWYLFAPLLNIWGNSADIWYVVRGFMLLIVAVTGYYIYKLERVLGLGGKEALAGVMVWLLLPEVLFLGSEFRPDNLMMMFFTAGAAYFFEYLNTRRRWLLQLSFGLLFLSLLSLQKVIILFVPLGVVCLWLLYRREILWKDFVIALLFPLGAAVALLVWLYFIGGLKDYWELNWLLNLKMQIISGLTNGPLIGLWIGGIVAVGVMCFKGQRNVRLICLMYLSMLVVLCFYRPWYPHYLLVYYPFLAVIMGFALRGIWRYKYCAVLLLLALVATGGRTVYLVREYRDNFYRCSVMKRYLQFILERTTENDVVLNDLDILVGDLRLPAQGYYWFSLGHMAALDYRHFKRRQLPNLDEVIKQRRPKIVANGFWRDCSLGNVYVPNLDCPLWDKVDKDYLYKHYDLYGFVYVRKD